MKRRLVVSLGLAVGCWCTGLAGCIFSGKGGLRSEAQTPIEEPAASADEAESPVPKGFFKATRRPSALSDEAAEVERNLGLR